jgi:hypothetical protein
MTVDEVRIALVGEADELVLELEDGTAVERALLPDVFDEDQHEPATLVEQHRVQMILVTRV